MTVWRTTARIMKRLSIGNILELEGIIVDNREGRACLKSSGNFFSHLMLKYLLVFYLLFAYLF